MSNPGTLNMIGYWNLDEASGDREDSHLIDFPMHDYSAVGSDTGKINLAAKFIRSSEDRLGYPYAPLLFPTTAFSWVTWINVSSFPGFMDVIATRQSTKNYVLMIDGDAKLRASVYSDDTNKTVYADSYGTLSIDEWVMVYFEAVPNSHVGISVNAGTLDTLAFTGSLQTAINPLRLGSNAGGGYNYFDGLMDETVMFGKTLTSAEITWMYNSGNARTYDEMKPYHLYPVDALVIPSLGQPTLLTPSNPGVADVVGFWEHNETDGSHREDSHVHDFLMTVYAYIDSDNGIQDLASWFKRAESSNIMAHAYDSLLFPTTAFSWITWLKVSSLPAEDMHIISTRYTEVSDYLLYIDEGTSKLVASVTVGGVYKNVSSDSHGVVIPDAWLMVYFEAIPNDHVGISINAGTLDTLSFTGAFDVDLEALFIKFGAKDSNFNFYDGLMDETVMFNRALTAFEVEWMYDNGAGRKYDTLAGEISLSTFDIITTPVIGIPSLLTFPSPNNPGLDDVVGFWELNETSGAREDSHINELTMSVYSAVGFDTGIIGNAAKFIMANEDSMGHVYDPLLFPTNDFSWITWIKLNSNTENMEIISTRDPSENYVLSIANGGRAGFSFYAGGEYKTVVDFAFGILPTDQWLMLYCEVKHDDRIGVSVNAHSLQIYSFNGVTTYIENPIYFGSNPGDYNHFDGLMDETVLFDRVLTPGEITWMYNGGNAITYDDLVKYNFAAANASTTPTIGVPSIVHIPIRVYPHVPQPPETATPIYILDSGSMDIFGMIEDYYSLIWTERYNEVGEFELEIPIEYDEHPFLAFGNLLYIKDSDRIMIIEDIKPSVSEERSSLLIKGQSTESLLMRRVLLEDLNVKGLAEAIVYYLLEENLTDASDIDRNIDIIKTTFPSTSITKQFEDQLKMQTVYEAVKKVCKTSSLGFKFEKELSKLAFIVYEGENRSYDQSENTYVIFSDNFDNVVSSSFYLSEKGKINVVLVATKVIDQYGDEEHAPSLERVFVWSASEPTGVDRYETILETEVKRTIKSNPPPEVEPFKVPSDPVLGIAGRAVLDAVNITTTPIVEVNTNEPEEPPPPPETPLTNGEVLSIITTRGDEILDTWKSVGLFEGDFDIHGNFEYGTDFFMGDIVQCNLEGRNVKARIIELVRSYSVEGLKTYVAFDFII